MKKIRFRIITLSCWLVLFSINSRLLQPIEISPLALGFVILMAVAGLALPRLPAVHRALMLFVTIVSLLAAKVWTGNFLESPAFFLAVAEISVITITYLLSVWVGQALIEFENAVAKMTLGQRESKIEPTISGQGSIYREIRRARNHQRPLALISFGIDENAIDPSDDKIILEIQRSMMMQYKLRGLSKMLCDQLEDCAVIVQDNNRYLAVLPDTLPEEIPTVVERLRGKAYNDVGVDIRIGVATLPDDGYTFEGLVQHAIQKMENDQETLTSTKMDQYPMERRTIK